MKKILLILMVFAGIVGINGQNYPTAPQVLGKAVNVMSDPKGVEASFSVGSSGYKGSGKIVSVSPKFHVSLPEVEVWYNGKDLYTLNRNTEETTVVVPTSEELAESNPLAYVGGASSNYNVAFSTVKKAGSFVLELTPKKKVSEVKRITLTLRQKDFVPEKIVIEPKSGNPIVAEISGFKTGISPAQSEFEYPKSSFPKVEIIDLR